jgi:hypothetical protein
MPGLSHLVKDNICYLFFCYQRMVRILLADMFGIEIEACPDDIRYLFFAIREWLESHL